ncbi:MAG: FlgD immunoglobulin-like domain containing protein, partial [Candidatus Poribacteria bacterium]
IELGKSQGRFSQSVTLGDGSNTLRVVVQDVAGNEVESDTYTVELDLAPPTTAPENITALPTADSRGIRVAWTADTTAGSYDVYRSLVPYDDASPLTALASRVEDTAYTDTTVLPGRMVYYAVVSVDAAGNSDASVISPVLATALIKGRGGVAALADGTRLAVPPAGLFVNVLLAATVEIDVPERTPDLVGALTGTAREVRARTASGATLTAFNLPATLTIPAPAGATVDDESPSVYRLAGESWGELDSTRSAAARTASASILASGVYQLAAPAPISETPWDINGDGVVNIVDLVTVATAFGTSGAGLPADIDRNGVVNIIDVVTVASHFGEETAAVAAAPALDRRDEPRAWIRLDRVGGDQDTVEFEVRVRSDVALAGYEFRLAAPEGASVVLTTAGSVLGDHAFWMPPVVGERSVTVAAARLGERRTGTADGVAARIVVRVGADAPTGDVYLRDIKLVDARGALVAHRVGPPAGLSQAAYVTDLLPNYPNPFNPDTWIPFTLADDSVVTIRIYGSTGATVRTLELGLVEGGDHRPRGGAAYWDGRNELGERVASGVYFYELEAGAFREMRRLVIVK